MNSLSKQTKQELYDALEGKQSGVFILNNKLVSVEVENTETTDENDSYKDLAQEIDEYSELKESLSRYTKNSDMKRYTGKELKEKRNERRK
jgi:hypothetical protein